MIVCIERIKNLRGLYKAIFILLVITSANLQAQVSTKGTDFWMGFIDQFDSSIETKIWISSATATSGTVSVPGQGWSQNFNVAANGTATVIIPTAQVYVGNSEVITAKAVHITSGAPVTVVASTYTAVRTETAMVFSTDVLGSEYYVMSYPGFSPGSEFMVVAAEDNTAIDITPSAATKGNKAAGATFTITLNKGQLYQVQAKTNTGDLTGSHIKASASNPCKKFAVFAGSTDTYVPTSCQTADPLFEEITPLYRWGKDYTIPPLTRVNGSVVRIVASQAGTSVSVDGGAAINLNAGQFNEQLLNNQSHCITSNKPILVAQYFKGNGCSAANPASTDPSMMILNANDQPMVNSVTFQPFSHNWIGARIVSVVIKSSFTTQLKLDGTTVAAGQFSAASCTGYSVATLTLTNATHTLFADSGFMAYCYGYGTGDESYASALGWSAPVNASVPVTASLSTSATSVCAPACATLTSTVSGGSGVYTYTWIPNIGTGPGPHNVCPTSNTTYSVIVTDNNPCTPTSDTAVMTVNVTTCNPPCNLVPNPGFETGACPTGQDQVPNASPWKKAGGSPDYFGKGCTQDWTASYYRNCSSRMSGFYTEWHPYNGQTPDYREYVQVQLTSPLVAGKSYCVTFFVRWANNMGGINTATDNIGAYFTTNAITPPAPGNGPYNINPQIESPKGSPINTLGWVAITGSFVATGGEQYITIGNFHDYNSTTFSNKTGTDRSYYFVDDVEVKECGVTCSAINITSADTTICPGKCASVSISVTGGTPPYTYAWSPNIGTGTGPYNVCPTSTTTYNVTVTDNASCPGSNSAAVKVTVLPSCGPAVTITGGSVCPGGCFNITSTVSGGTSPYTYLWSGGGATTANYNACPGTTTTYTITVTDNSGGTSTDTAVVTILSPPSGTIVKTDVSCFSGSNGTATVTGNSGTSPYSYSWSGISGSGSQVSGLSQGTYTATITDNKGCTSTATSQITEPVAVSVTSGSAPAQCGQNNGSATATVTGGTAPYTYQWSAGSNQFVASNLSSGTFTVTVTDNKGCSSTAAVTVSSTGATVASITASTNALCAGTTNGTATASGSGGTAPFTYSWSGGMGNAATAGNLSAGTYTVTVTDATGCPATATVVITQPPAITATATKTNANCNGADGTATITAGGGSSGYTYQWTGGPASNVYSNIAQGIYTVRITDSNGCTKDTTVTVGNNIPVINLSLTKTDANCGGSDGSATVTAGGGSSPYTYLWSGVSGTTFQVSGLSQGTYSVTVTDANGCSGTSIVSVGDVGSPSLNATGTDIKCNGQSTGSVTSTVNGGVLPYTYTWSSGQTTPIISNVSAGTYTLTVTGQNGCSVQQVVTLTEPSALSLTTGKADANCGQADGSASVNASGGTGTYSYSWSGVSGSTFQVTGLLAGTYTVTVTDANGCTATAVENVADIGAPSVTAVKTDVICSGGTSGTASATPTGGVLPYTYLWSNGTTTDIISSVPAGTYTVTIIGNNGCKVTTTVVINEPADITLAISNTDELCGSGNGTATVTASGGTGTFSYLWSGVSGSGFQVSGLSQGAYSVTVTDASGCTKVISTSVGNIADYGPKATFTVNPTVTEILAPTINFYDQTGGLTSWSWDFGDGTGDSVQNPVHTYKDTGTYQTCLSITNQYGCSSNTCLPVTIKPIWSFYIPNAFTPDGDGRNDLFAGYGYGIQQYEMYIFDRWGDLLFKSENITKQWDGKANDGVDLVQEDVYVYLFLIKDVFGKQHRYSGSVTVVK